MAPEEYSSVAQGGSPENSHTQKTRAFRKSRRKSTQRRTLRLSQRSKVEAEDLFFVTRRS